jgi:uncharacterized membrane protein HdeD (DUF308 family)
MSQSDVQSFTFYGDDAASAKSVVRVLQTGLFIGALIALVAGGAILAWPGGSSTVIALIFGIYFLIRGLVRVAVGIFGPGLTGGGRALSIVIGILLIVVGVFAFKSPSGILELLGILIGIMWIIDGIATLVESGRGSSRGIAITLGLISLIAGVAVLFVPAAAVDVLIILGGVFLIVIGVAQAIGAFTIGRMAKRGQI